MSGRKRKTTSKDAVPAKRLRIAKPNVNMNLTIDIKYPAILLKMANLSLKFLENFRFQVIRKKQYNILELISLDSAHVCMVKWTLKGVRKEDSTDEDGLIIDTDKNYDFTIPGPGFQSALAGAVSSKSNLIIQMGTDDSKLIFHSVNNKLSSTNNIKRTMTIPLIYNEDEIRDLGIPISLSLVMENDTFNDCIKDITGFATENNDTVYIKFTELNAEQMTAVFRLSTHPEDVSVGCVINGKCKYLPVSSDIEDSVKVAIASAYLSKLAGAKLSSEISLDLHQTDDSGSERTYLFTYSVKVPFGEFKVSMTSRVEEL